MKHDSKEDMGGEVRGSLVGPWRALTLAGALLALGTWPVGAHPGHGLTEVGAAHVVMSPYHLSVLFGGTLASGLGLALAARVVRSERARRLMQVGSGCALFAAAVLWLR